VVAARWRRGLKSVHLHIYYFMGAWAGRNLRLTAVPVNECWERAAGRSRLVKKQRPEQKPSLLRVVYSNRSCSSLTQDLTFFMSPFYMITPHTFHADVSSFVGTFLHYYLCFCFFLNCSFKIRNRLHILHNWDWGQEPFSSISVFILFIFSVSPSSGSVFLVGAIRIQAMLRISYAVTDPTRLPWASPICNEHQNRVVRPCFEGERHLAKDVSR